MSRIQGKFIESFKETWTTNTTRVFNHSLNSTDVVVTMWNLTSGEATLPDSMVITDANNVTITVSALPGAGLRVIILAL
jgi:hypothetical protein